LALGLATPNPANPSTSWWYTLPEEQRVRVAVYNSLGQEIRVIVDDVMPAGRHRVEWNGTDAVGRIQASGLYLYVLETGAQRLVRKVSLVR
jgi:flagellar hook assembly protein FlgD